ncbi:DoxX family protein [Taibaiella chishuiensis]|uniref:Thiosulfate dehydrogenase [quinone] large subunit n=1 Tax=Taibaiella chishuiensis TaxID=1434707 RepID=A0A2P8D826_9BACT|nr:DoxX family membrane protein [Taibaiella chishuiensis]PSK93331.1 thiosulfate dehydrogenase [quinone] large subunit [Taibaiella chishuiensis]
MNTTAFLLLRLAAGLSMLGHGLVRMPKLRAFSDWMTGQFAGSLLPAPLVRPFSLVLPFAELLTGLLLVAGLWTRPALIAAAGVMLLLILGTTLVENWEALPSQLIHIAFFALLLQFIDSNRLSADQLIRSTP